MKQWRTVLDMAGNLITNIAPPQNPSDAATKGYVDGRIVNEVSIQNEEPTDGTELWVDWDAT